MIAFKTPIHTTRLTLKPQSMHDFERYYAMSVDARVMQYIGDGQVYGWTREVAREKFRRQVAGQIRDGQSILAVYRRRPWIYAGWCAVTPSRFLEGTELGYRLCQDAWGRGYATEAAEAILLQAFDNPDLDHVLACAHPDNLASIRVLEKLGFAATHTKLSRPIQRRIPVFTLQREAFLSCHGVHT